MTGRGFDARRLGSIFNDDSHNILRAHCRTGMTPGQYKQVILALLKTIRPGVFTPDVGDPDPVAYRSAGATYYSKYLVEVCRALQPDFVSPELAQGICSILDAFVEENTDILQLSVEACREHGALIVPSYRMNAEDYYHMQGAMSDFDRAHGHLRIPGRHCLDPAHVEVYMHRLDLFREMVENYDVDGIELNFRRWQFMISKPLHNYPVLTRLVADVRRRLDEAASRKGRGRLILGVRVCPMLEGPYIPEEFPGSHYHQYENPSCRDAGLDVKTWIDSGAVDYVAPMLFNTFLPGLPKTREFVDLASGSGVGIYPTLFSCPMWLYPAHGRHVPPGGAHEPPIELSQTERMQRYKNELCQCALKLYADGADGISTFNWYCIHQAGVVKEPEAAGTVLGPGGKKVLAHVGSLLADRTALEAYYRSDAVLPDGGLHHAPEGI